MRDTMDELFDNEKLPTKPPLSKRKQFMFIFMLLTANILLVTYAVFPYAILYKYYKLDLSQRVLLEHPQHKEEQIIMLTVERSTLNPQITSTCFMLNSINSITNKTAEVIESALMSGMGKAFLLTSSSNDLSSILFRLDKSNFKIMKKEVIFGSSL